MVLRHEQNPALHKRMTKAKGCSRENIGYCWTPLNVIAVIVAGRFQLQAKSLDGIAP